MTQFFSVLHSQLSHSPSKLLEQFNKSQLQSMPKVITPGNKAGQKGTCACVSAALSRGLLS